MMSKKKHKIYMDYIIYNAKRNQIEAEASRFRCTRMIDLDDMYTKNEINKFSILTLKNAFLIACSIVMVHISGILFVISFYALQNQLAESRVYFIFAIVALLVSIISLSIYLKSIFCIRRIKKDLLMKNLL